MPEIRNTLDISVNCERWWKDGWEGLKRAWCPLREYWGWGLSVPPRPPSMIYARFQPSPSHQLGMIPYNTQSPNTHPSCHHHLPLWQSWCSEIMYCRMGVSLLIQYHMEEVLRELKLIHEQVLCINTEGLNQPSPNHHHRWSMMILIICKVHGPNGHHKEIITIHQTNDIGFIRADEGIRCAEFNRCTLWPFYGHFVPPP